MHILVSLIIFVLVAGACWWCLNKLITAFGLPPPISAVVQVIFVLVCLGALLDYFGIYHFNIH